MILKKVQWYMGRIEEELDDAQTYAEKYLLNSGWSQEWGKMYHEMARQELTHAVYLRKMADEHIKMLEHVPEETEEAWEHCQRRAIERTAEIESILNK